MVKVAVPLNVVELLLVMGMQVPIYAIIKEVESIKKWKFLSKAKKEIVCALVNCGCRGRTEFKREFEAFLCDCHHRWAIRKSWNSWNNRIA